MAAAHAAENHGDEWGLTWYLWWGIYTSIPKWTHKIQTAAVEALSLKISSNGTSLKWSEINPKEQDCGSHSQESK